MQSAIQPEPATATDIPDAFTLRRGEPVRAPVIFASPHSGTIYPEEMTKLLSVPLTDLQRTEDAFVDELYESAPELGGILMSAIYARGFVDLNRDAEMLLQVLIPLLSFKLKYEN